MEIVPCSTISRDIVELRDDNIGQLNMVMNENLVQIVKTSFKLVHTTLNTK